MKKVSVELFFTVLWRGVCQVLGWFFGLFGYKRDGKFAKCVWGLFATSTSFIMAVLALAIICVFIENVHERYIRGHHCDVVGCHHSEYIGRNIYFHNTDDGKGYIYNSLTGEKTLKHVAWIAKPLGNDSLVCFSNGKKRGYFNRHTGKVVIEPKYSHAWVFSEGLASVEKDGVINFIDGSGHVAIDMDFPYFNGMDGYVFHGGYCVVYGDTQEAYGLIDKKGKTVLPCLYSRIQPSDDLELWCLKKGKEMAVIDNQFKPVIPFMDAVINIGYSDINVIMSDHTIRKYNMSGELIDDFYVTDVYKLEYEKDEVLYRSIAYVDGDENSQHYWESYHPKATARLRTYVAGGGYKGLMTADGHVVTMPLYESVEALSEDLYLCSVSYCDKVVINGKGEIVR